MMKTTIRRYLIFLPLLPAVFFLAGCGKPAPACPVGTGTPARLTLSPAELPSPTPGAASIEVEIGGRLVRVDKVVEGPLCNDTWSGTVYVTCNVQVYGWQETPTFLKNCSLNIAEDTVVYVAYHNDTAYYKGCSCHTGEIAEP
jgi:hypothetical protein